MIKRKENTHYTRCLDYLKTNGSITSYQAIHHLGNIRLGATIKELRNDGHDIITETIMVDNRYTPTTNKKSPVGKYIYNK